jgi:TPR repeat protein
MNSVEPVSSAMHDLAFKYYQIAYDANHGWATNNLGLLYRDGHGLARDNDKAYDYFLKASGENNSWSYINLAEMAFTGRRPARDISSGIAWLEKGAANGCTLCLMEEAAIYHSGSYRIPADPDKTLALLNKAAALGDSQAALMTAKLYLVGDGVAQSSAKAFEALKTLSDRGYADATDLMGELSADKQILEYVFQSSLGGVKQIPADLHKSFPQDPSAAIRYWELASRQGSCQALVDLSSVFDRGIGVGADSQSAATYVEQAFQCEPSNGFYTWKLAMRYFDAKGRAHDCEVAAKLLTKSLRNGYADSAVNLGYIYDKGCSPIARDDHRAFQIYLLGAKLGVALCQNNLGAMIKHGRGVAADPARGYGWIKLAAMKGDELAKRNLNDPLFTPTVRAVGLTQLASIQSRLLTTPNDQRAIMSDPWY